MREGLSLAGLLLLAVPAQADSASEPICADRPGKASATCTAPAGHVQLETGLADWLRDNGESTWALGATAIKYGLTERSHIEVDVAPFVHDAGRSGVGDTLVRFKQRLTAADAPVQVTLYPYVKLPTAGHGLGNGKVEAGLVVPLSHDIAGTKLSLALSPEADWLADADGHGRHGAMVQVASLGWDASDRLNLSVELWGQWDWDPAGTQRQTSADAAIAFAPRDDLQLDGGVNVGLNRQTPDVELYAGIAKRF